MLAGANSCDLTAAGDVVVGVYSWKRAGALAAAGERAPPPPPYSWKERGGDGGSDLGVVGGQTAPGWW